MTQKQSQQKATHDRKAKFQEFQVGQTVMAQNLRPGDDWVPATVVERTGPVSYFFSSQLLLFEANTAHIQVPTARAGPLLQLLQCMF